MLTGWFSQRPVKPSIHLDPEWRRIAPRERRNDDLIFFCFVSEQGRRFSAKAFQFFICRLVLIHPSLSSFPDFRQSGTFNRSVVSSFGSVKR